MTKKQTIYQLASCVAIPDAVSNYILKLDHLIRTQANADTKIFTTFRSPQVKNKNILSINEFRKFSKNANNILINQYSIFDPSAELFLAATAKVKVFIYHNITPAKFFDGYNDEIAAVCRKGRQMLPQFKDVDLAVTLSEYSRQELISAGFEAHKVQVIPYLNDLSDRFQQFAGQRDYHQQCHILSVGKIAPHKKVEDSIKTFYLYLKHFNPQAHLHLVGVLGQDLYEEELRALVNKLDLSAHITFHNKVSNKQLSNLFNRSHLFLTMSEHEGFCVPLIEAMTAKLPIIAYNQSAIADTLGDSGIQFSEKNFGMMAAAIDQAFQSATLRRQVLQQQSQQLECLTKQQNNVDQLLRKLV